MGAAERVLIVGALALAPASACGCAASSPSQGGDQADDGADGAGATGAGGAGGAVAQPDAGDPFDAAALGDGSGGGCSAEAELVHVVDYERNVYRFDPPTLAFTQLGQLSCASTLIFSMAVDRNAVAWALALDGTMVRYDIATDVCTPVAFASGQHGFITFGMGFSSDSPGSSEETLFVASAADLGLATIDTGTLALDPVGPYDALQGRVELTGTGAGQLFGVFEGEPYVVAEIGKASAEILSQAPQDDIELVPGGSNFAFAFWGGDFWLFVGHGPGTTDVYRYQPSSQTTTKVAQALFEIVGAGVSTCAPTRPPS